MLDSPATICHIGLSNDCHLLGILQTMFVYLPCTGGYWCAIIGNAWVTR